MNNNVISISALGLAEDRIYRINKLTDDIYLIDDECIVEVSSSINCRIVDNTIDKNVKIIGDKASVINYTILNSKNSKRVFDIKGELIINEIVIDDTVEDLLVNLKDENASCDVKLLSIASNAKSVFSQYIDHQEKNTYSNISNVGVALNMANITFDTTGKIEKGMNKTKCSQLSRGIVMDDGSKVTSKPILLIDEYDCFANHGATIGKMSDEDLFYLMSRGLCKADAFLLILKGIIMPFVDSLFKEEYKIEIEAKIKNLIEK